MTIKLSEWERHFPDGISLSTYQRIGRILRQYGTYATWITMVEWTEEELRKELDRIEHA